MTGLLVLTAAAALLYENDFSTRTSAEPPGAAWSVYTYDKGGPLAYDYLEPDAGALNRQIAPYTWFDQGTGMGGQQDGWVKKFREHKNRKVNMGISVVSDEADPALLLTNSKDTSYHSTNRLFAITHPFRNIFTNGEVRLTFDMRTPNGYTRWDIYCWLGPIFEQQLNNANNYVLKNWPLQAGFRGSVLSGGRRDPAGPSGTRQYVDWGSYTGLHWYRFDILMRLGSSEFDLTIYDLGTGRIDIDATPGGAPLYSETNNKFVSDMNAGDGGLAGLGIVCGRYDTGAPYGEAGFNDDLTPKIDNIKASYKAPGGERFR
jgi:hypothetical protein